MHQNMVFSTEKYEKFSGEHNPLPRPFPNGEGGIPLPMPHPARRLRHLNPSHCKILGTALWSDDSKCIWAVKSRALNSGFGEE